MHTRQEPDPKAAQTGRRNGSLRDGLQPADLYEMCTHSLVQSTLQQDVYYSQMQMYNWRNRRLLKANGVGRPLNSTDNVGTSSERTASVERLQ
jgi:hypothetical protein